MALFLGSQAIGYITPELRSNRAAKTGVLLGTGKWALLQNHLLQGSSSVSPWPAGFPSMNAQPLLSPRQTSIQLWLPFSVTLCHAGVPTTLAATPTARRASTSVTEIPVQDAVAKGNGAHRVEDERCLARFEHDLLLRQRRPKRGAIRVFVVSVNRGDDFINCPHFRLLQDRQKCGLEEGPSVCPWLVQARVRENEVVENFIWHSGGPGIAHADVQGHVDCEGSDS
eukprot:CAMPEP_0184496814 /NCGR_PEP_ID=MMETSP0113_2-20130426/34947_1 /TAXON_ID=91329 /ORGANISM="Norrisiella sphaerica, Strain BC52" /LENGTH=225 /DNA_ID=CAMNT_0026883621 /DNA_START=198 /DNA_END=874 /DNA_ORIENTATION=+